MEKYDRVPMSVASEASKRLMLQFVESIRTKNSQIMNHNTEMLSAVENMNRLRLSWKKAEDENTTLMRIQTKLEADIDERDGKIKTLQAELKDARTQVRTLLGDSNALKADLDAVENRFALVKDLLKNQIDTLSSDDRKRLAFLRDPGLIRKHSQRIVDRYKVETETGDSTSENLDYDMTGDSLDIDDEPPRRVTRPAGRTSGHRTAMRSTSAQPSMLSSSKRSRLVGGTNTDTIDEELNDFDDPLPRKRSKNKDQFGEIRTTTTVTVDPEGVRPSRARVTIKRSMNRSMSESNIAEENRVQSANRNMRDTVGRTTSTMDLRTPLRQAQQSWARGGPIENRQHSFEKMSAVFMMSNCDVCHRSINFAAKPAVKCLDCHQLVHVSCSKNLSVPCIPRSGATPVKTPARGRNTTVTYRLQDFCPTTSPMIPYPIIHCVVALEKRGMTQEGLYRVPGQKTQVTQVLNELRTSRGIPRLDLQDVFVIPDCIKQFLRELRDPLIPRSSREEFIRAAQGSNQLSLNTAICDLPSPNRDTLAYLVLHWQKVMALSTLNKMPKENIARCVSLSVMGTSNYTNKDMSLAERETEERKVVLLELLSLPMDYWQRFLDVERNGPTSVQRTASRAVENPQYSSRSKETSAVDQSMLGPVSDSPDHTPHGGQNLIRPKPIRPKYFERP